MFILFFLLANIKLQLVDFLSIFLCVQTKMLSFEEPTLLFFSETRFIVDLLPLPPELREDITHYCIESEALRDFP